MTGRNHKTSKNASKRKNNINDENKVINIIYLLPILFIVGILPLIMRLHNYKANLSDYNWFSKEDNYVDFFLYYKQLTFVVVLTIMAFLIIYRFIKDKKNLHYPIIFIPLTIYACLILLSTLFSKYKYFGFHGVFEQFESVFVLLGYCLTVYYVYTFVKTEKQIMYIIGTILISSILLGLLGLSQITNHDFFTTMSGWRMITPPQYWSLKDSFNFHFLGTVYLTLFNPNYVGSYASMVLPLLITRAIITKNTGLKITYLCAALGVILCLIGSKSTTGIFSIVLGCFLALILFRKQLFKNRKILIGAITFVVLGIIILNIKFNSFMINQYHEITNIEKSTPALTEIQTNTDNIIVKYNANSLQIGFSLGEEGRCKFDVSDAEAIPVKYVTDTTNDSVTLQDGRFPGFVLTPCLNGDGALAFSVTIDGTPWYFTNQVLDNTYYFINNYGKYDKMMTAPSALFTGYENYATRRGYIWSRTLPLLKDKIILGSGAESFIFVFPNQDYVNKYNYQFINEVISKPHNMYLQIGVQSGVLSLISFLVFFIMYFVSSLKLYIKGSFMNYYSYIGATILISTTCYMISGFANDSNITVAPLFWVLLGLGIAINHIVKRKTLSA